MRKTISLSVLIASALFLSAASRQAGPDEHQKAATEQTDTTQQQQQLKEFLATLQSSQTAFLNTLRSIQTQEEANAKQERAQYEAWYAPSVLIEFGLLLAGALYTFFTYRQLSIFKASLAETAKAANAAKESSDAAIKNADAAEKQVVALEKTLVETAKAADAAKKATEIAKTALRADRPLIRIVSVKMDKKWPRQSTCTIKVRFQNCGGRPVMITAAYPKPVVLVAGSKPRPIYDATTKTHIQEAIVAVDGKSDLYDFWCPKLESPDAQPIAIANRTMELHLYGTIFYQDASFGERYETAFSWTFRVYGPPEEPFGYFSVGDPTLQHWT